jgi:hypothetical protein
MKKNLFVSIIFTLGLLFPLEVFGANGFAQTLSIKNNLVAGNVVTLAGNTLTLKLSKVSTNINEIIDPKTIIIAQDKKIGNINTIKPSDFIYVISTDSSSGSTVSAGMKKALKIYIKNSTPSAQLQRKIYMGMLSAIDGNFLILSNSTDSAKSTKIKIQKDTKIMIRSIPKATQADLKMGDRVLVFGNPDNAGTISAKIITVIPLKNNHIFITPTFGASISATPTRSASISATPTVLPTLKITPTRIATITATPLSK